MLELLQINFYLPFQVKNKKRWSQVMYMSYVLDYKKSDDREFEISVFDFDCSVAFYFGPKRLHALFLKYKLSPFQLDVS